MTVSMNVSHFVKICQVLTIIHQLICRGVANFGTRCTYHNTLQPYTGKVKSNKHKIPGTENTYTNIHKLPSLQLRFILANCIFNIF